MENDEKIVEVEETQPEKKTRLSKIKDKVRDNMDLVFTGGLLAILGICGASMTRQTNKTSKAMQKTIEEEHKAKMTLINDAKNSGGSTNINLNL